MGYNTEFSGQFNLNKKLDKATHEFLTKFNQTRRVKRRVDPKYGVEGEFYVDGKGYMGQDKDETIIDSNSPPMTQPNLWCQWKPTEDGRGIEWDGCEKFYDYQEWLEYLLEKVLIPRGYTLSGLVHYQGEDDDDFGELDGDAITLDARQSLESRAQQPETVVVPTPPLPSVQDEEKRSRKILWMEE